MKNECYGEQRRRRQKEAAGCTKDEDWKRILHAYWKEKE
jgi:hypothetical protein